MKKELLIKGEALQASVASALAAEQFLNDHYLFRRNKLNGKVEFSIKPAEGQEPVFRPLTQEALNSIILRAKREDICEGANPKTDIVEFIHSKEVRAYDPIGDYLNNLPQWDGQNHVAQLFSRLPGMFIDNDGEIDYEQLYAQVLYELREQKAPYWFNNDEVARIQQLNQGYMEQKDILEIIKVCFRKPEEGEIVKSMNASELLGIIQDKYPTVSDDLGTRVRLGKAMKLLEYDSTNRGHISYYKAVPQKVA